MLDLCRICLCGIHPSNSVNVYLKTADTVSIIEIMKECASIEVNFPIEDELPKFICTICVEKLNFVYGFRNLIISSDMRLKMQIQYNKKCTLQGDISENVLNEQPQSNIEEVLIKEESNEALINENCNDYNPIEILVPPVENVEQKQTIENGFSNTDDVIKVEKKSYKCKECGKVLNSWYNLKKHQIEHTGVQHVCKVCNKGFTTKMNLVVHSRIHTGDKPLSCSVCGKNFRCSGSLATHKRRHKGVKKYHCNVCNKGFYESSGYRIHMRIHTGERPFMCEVCGKTFYDNSSFLGHMTKQHQTNELPCSICGKIFGNEKALRGHVRRHSGLKEYGCEECGKKFTALSCLNMHRKTIHFGIRAHKCSICEKSFTQSSTLIKHMLTHTGEKPFPCTLCSKEFTYKQHLQSHMKKYHKDVEETTTLKSE